MINYARLQWYAIAISFSSILYNGAEGGISIGFGAESASRSLVFFGVQSGIEVASAAIVMWRFRKIAKPGEEAATVISEQNLRVERIGTWSIGLLLAALAFATEVSAIVGLALHFEPDSSNASLIISASALVIMILIWLPKRYLARALNSSTMQGEAVCSLSCIQITIVLFTGSLIFRLWKGGWWVDSATSLILGLMFGRESWKMISWVRNPKFNGGCCDNCQIAVPNDEELQEPYKDLCSCCREKDECLVVVDTCDCSVNRNGSTVHCCNPARDCCSKDSKGVRPLAQGAACEDKCCATKKPKAAKVPCKDKCCSDVKKPVVADTSCKDKCCSDAKKPAVVDTSCKDKCCSESSKVDVMETKKCEDGCCSVDDDVPEDIHVEPLVPTAAPSAPKPSCKAKCCSRDD